MSPKNKAAAERGNGTNLGFEQKLWAAADKMRGYGEFRLPKEVATSLTHLLLGTAAKATVDSRCVITTSPSIWLPLRTSGNFRIVDVSRLLGSVGWETERDIEDRVVYELVGLGWPEQLVQTGSKRVRGGTGEQSSKLQLHNLPPTARMLGAPDITLCTADGSPVAAVEVKRDINSALAVLKDAWFFHDYKHDRGPATGTGMQDKGGELRDALSGALKKISFLIDYPLRYIVDEDAVRNSSRVIVRSLVLRGDHPSWPQDSREFAGLLKKNDVYIEVGPDQWVDLFPFVTIQTCSMCKIHETYFIDRCNFDKKKAALKSFERGHTKDSTEIGEALVAIIDLQRQAQRRGGTNWQEEES